MKRSTIVYIKKIGIAMIETLEIMLSLNIRISQRMWESIGYVP